MRGRGLKEAYLFTRKVRTRGRKGEEDASGRRSNRACAQELIDECLRTISRRGAQIILDVLTVQLQRVWVVCEEVS
jgi:hypothetical protein